MTVIGSLLVELGLDPSAYVEGLGEASSVASLAASSMVDKFSMLGGSLVQGAIGLAGAGVVALTAYVWDGVAAASEAEMITTRLTRTLQNTSESTGVTSKMIEDLARQYQRLTRYEDDEIVSAAAVMARFDTINAETFPRAIAVAMDLSESLGIDLSQASLMTAKALAEPGVGLMRLKVAGATFTDETERMIMAMVEAGDTAGAQAMILKALEDSIGGTALAAGETFIGQWTTLRNVLGNVGEEMTAGLLPGLKALITLLLDFVSSSQVQTWLENVGTWFGALGEQIVRLVNVVADTGLAGLFVTFADGSNYLGSFLQLFGMGVDSAYAFGAQVNEVVAWIVDAFDWLVTKLQTDKAAVVAILAMLAVPILAFVYSTLIPAAVAVISTILPIVAALALVAGAAYVLYSAWQSDWGGLRTFIMEMWFAYLKPVFDQVVSWLVTNIPIAVQAVKDWFVNVLIPAMQMTGVWIRENVIPALVEIYTWLATNIPIAVQAMSDWYNSVLIPALSSVWGWINNNLVPALVEIYTWLATNIPIAVQVMSDFWNGVLLPAFMAVWGFLNESIFPLLQALGEFLGAVFNVVITAAAGLWQNVLLPAFMAVWGFLNESIFPLLQALGEFLGAVFNVVITAAAGLWQNVLLPAFVAVSDFLTSVAIPVFESLATILSQTLGPVIEDVGEFLDGVFAPAIDSVGDAIATVIGWIESMTDALRKLELPPWLTPGSPTPWELGLIGITGAMRELAHTALPELEASLALPDAGRTAIGQHQSSGQMATDVTYNVYVTGVNEADVIRGLHEFQTHYGRF